MIEKLLEQLAPLIPVVVGALIALGGGWIKYFVERREQRRTRRREKLERFLSLVYELKSWTDDLDACLVFGTSDKDISSPIEEIQVLSDLYFHDLHDETKEVTIAALEYKGAMHSLASERQRTGAVSPDANSKVSELYPPLLKAIERVAVKARPLAKKLS